MALDEGPGPPLRSPYADLSKLYAVVGILVRSCDVTCMEKSLYEVCNTKHCTKLTGIVMYDICVHTDLASFYELSCLLASIMTVACDSMCMCTSYAMNLAMVT